MEQALAPGTRRTLVVTVQSAISEDMGKLKIRGVWGDSDEASVQSLSYLIPFFF